MRDIVIRRDSMRVESLPLNRSIRNSSKLYNHNSRKIGEINVDVFLFEFNY